MVSARDIAPVPRKVDIRGTEFIVKGLDLRLVIDIFVAFPDVEAMIMGRGNLGALIMVAPDAVAAIIAAGMRAPDEAEHIAKLVIDDQLALLTPIVELTMPNGIGPFAVLMEKLGIGKSGAAPAMRAPATNLPQPPQASSAPDTLKKK